MNKYDGAITGAEQLMFYCEQVKNLQSEGYFCLAADAMADAWLAGQHLDYDARTFMERAS